MFGSSLKSAVGYNLRTICSFQPSFQLALFQSHNTMLSCCTSILCTYSMMYSTVCSCSVRFLRFARVASHRGHAGINRLILTQDVSKNYAVLVRLSSHVYRLSHFSFILFSHLFLLFNSLRMITRRLLRSSPKGRKQVKDVTKTSTRFLTGVQADDDYNIQGTISNLGMGVEVRHMHSAFQLQKFVLPVSLT